MGPKEGRTEKGISVGRNTQREGERERETVVGDEARRDGRTKGRTKKLTSTTTTTIQHQQSKVERERMCKKELITSFQYQMHIEKRKRG